MVNDSRKYHMMLICLYWTEDSKQGKVWKNVQFHTRIFGGSNDPLGFKDCVNSTTRFLISLQYSFTFYARPKLRHLFWTASLGEYMRVEQPTLSISPSLSLYRLYVYLLGDIHPVMCH